MVNLLATKDPGVVTLAMSFSIFGLQHPATGDTISGIFRIEHKIDVKLFAGLREPDSSPVIVEGAELVTGRFSIYDARVVDCGDILMLSLNEQSWSEMFARTM